MTTSAMPDLPQGCQHATRRLLWVRTNGGRATRHLSSADRHRGANEQPAVGAAGSGRPGLEIVAKWRVPRFVVMSGMLAVSARV